MSSTLSIDVDGNAVALVRDGQRYDVSLRRYRHSRSVKLSVDPVRQTVSLSMPSRYPRGRAIAFLADKIDWLSGQLAKAPRPRPIAVGETIPFLGSEHRIIWRHDAPRQPRLDADRIVVGGPEVYVPRRVEAWLKAEARRRFSADLGEYCRRADVTEPRLSVGDARRRWGSCSSRGSIRLSWRLVMAPEMVRRSVVAHEVAHLRHMNHGHAFHALLSEIFEGDLKAADSWLRVHGPALHLVGAGQTGPQG